MLLNALLCFFLIFALAMDIAGVWNLHYQEDTKQARRGAYARTSPPPASIGGRGGFFYTWGCCMPVGIGEFRVYMAAIFSENCYNEDLACRG